jgi:hypothetical protein
MTSSSAPACRSLTRTALGVCVCLAVGVWAATPATAGQEQPGRGPQKLWKAFPLNPTNEPLATLEAPSLAIAPKRPPVASARSDSSSDTMLPLLAYAASGALVLMAFGLMALHVQRARTQRRPVVSSQVVVGFDAGSGVTPRFIPDIEAHVRGHRSRKRMVIALGRPPLRVRLLPAKWMLRRGVGAVRRLAHDLRVRRSSAPRSLTSGERPPTIIRRARRRLRSEEVKAVLVGMCIAVVFAYVIVHSVS